MVRSSLTALILIETKMRRYHSLTISGSFRFFHRMARAASTLDLFIS